MAQKYPIAGEESIMSAKAHGTINAPLQSSLRSVVCVCVSE